MKISERSWHLRFARWSYRLRSKEGAAVYTPTDLCQYVWRGLVTGLVFLVMASVIIVVASPLLLAGAIYDIVTDWQSKHPRLSTPAAPRAPRASNLFVTYLLAKKRRVCPLIEVVPDTHGG